MKCIRTGMWASECSDCKDEIRKYISTKKLSNTRKRNVMERKQGNSKKTNTNT